MTIDIQAIWVSQGSTILATASPNAYSKDWVGVPISNRYYPSALANQLAGRDLTSASFDIQINCNRDWDSGVNSAAGDTRSWYYGLDGVPAGDDFDFYGVMLHEFGHGMGFSSFLNPDGTWANGFPDIYDHFLVDGSFNQPLYTMSQSSRSQMVTNGNLYSFGGNVQGINGGSGAKIHAPPTFIAGQARSHLDETTYSNPGSINELLTPIISVPTHNIGPLAIAIFRDMGYSMVDNLAPTATITSVTNGQHFSATPTCAGTAIDNSSTGDDGAVGLWNIRCALARTSDGAWWDWINSVWGSTTFNSASNASSPTVSLIPISRGTRNWDMPLPTLIDGDYQVQVSAIDQLGQSSPWSSATFTIDSSAPAIAFSPLTNNQSVFNFNRMGGTVSEA
ncbi:MAG TPA: hypothetical protein VM260_15240, partial [Pirellula sp.]|nr:hypothetical protein [Pirellula sp.]